MLITVRWENTVVMVVVVMICHGDGSNDAAADDNVVEAMVERLLGKNSY